jgi:hypothetical protein
MPKRKEITSILTKASVGWLVKKKYSVHLELGIEKWGKQRADVFGISLSTHMIQIEVKSCKEDWLVDKKWINYLDKSHAFYFAISDSLYRSNTGKLIKNQAADHKVGILVLCPKTGFMKVRVKAKHQPIEKDTILRLMTKIAWRGGKHCGNSRRTRYFL